METLSMKERLMMIEAVCIDLKPDERTAYLKGLILEGWYREALREIPPQYDPVIRANPRYEPEQRAVKTEQEAGKPSQDLVKPEPSSAGSGFDVTNYNPEENEAGNVEKNDDAENKSEKPHAGRKPTWDTGKASALWRAGWPKEKIIEELRLDGSKQLDESILNKYQKRHPEMFPERERDVK